MNGHEGKPPRNRFRTPPTPLERTPENVIKSALQSNDAADLVMRALANAGYELIDTLGDVETEVAEIMAEIKNAEDK